MRNIFWPLSAILFQLLILPQAHAEPFQHETYVVSYAEAPIGQHPIDFSSYYYSEDECDKMAKREAENFAVGQIYGYSFELQVENPITKRGEYFTLTPEVTADFFDKTVVYTEIENNESDFYKKKHFKLVYKSAELQKNSRGTSAGTYEEIESDLRDRKRFKLTYKLLEAQKSHRKNFTGTLAESSKGEDLSQNCQYWDLRNTAFENAVKNAVLNKARKNIKSRPEYISGKVMLKESPQITINNGLWRAIVYVSIRFDEVTYQASY